MAHKFNPGKMCKLDDPGRIKLLPAREILLRAGLKGGDTFLDVGAGTGYFAFPASEIVGSDGKVIAVDVSGEMVAELQARAAKRGARNMEIRKSAEYDVMVEHGVVDLAFMCAVLHEIDEKARFLARIKITLKPAGRLCIVEWVKRVMDMGPPVGERLEMTETEELLGTVGLKVVGRDRLNDFFYSVSGARSE